MGPFVIKLPTSFHHLWPCLVSNRDGHLSPIQCQQAFTIIGFPDNSMAVVHVPFHEFCRFVSICKKNSFANDPVEGTLRLTFRLMDVERKEAIGADELLRHLRAIGVQLNRDQAEKIAEHMYAEDDQRTFTEDDFVEFIKTQLSLS